jgi:hypothetical protein
MRTTLEGTREPCLEELSVAFLIHCVVKRLGSKYKDLIKHVQYNEHMTIESFKSKLLRAEADLKKGSMARV